MQVHVIHVGHAASVGSKIRQQMFLGRRITFLQSPLSRHRPCGPALQGWIQYLWGTIGLPGHITVLAWRPNKQKQKNSRDTLPLTSKTTLSTPSHCEHS